MHSLDDLRAGRLLGATRLDLSAQLRHFPSEIFDLADSLEILNLTGNQLTELPADLHRLRRLKVLFCSDNLFTELPEAVGACAQLQTVGFRSNRIREVTADALPAGLRALILTDNRIETLPEALGHCQHLQKLMLAGNRLTALPESLQQCQRLELLRIASNRLSALPDWLLRLPRLAWLAYADNPLPAGFQAPLEAALCPRIDWATLTLAGELGRGASGVIHAAQWTAQAAPVAVKVYKGAITSDGSPQAEMTACLAAGDHPHLVQVAGRVDDHPEHVPALVMQRIPAQWRNLAGPPTLDSCTRDQYGAGPTLAMPALLRLAEGIASVAAHLHARGINHGDLYGHNILVHAASGQCLLSDFGAASFYPPGGALQALEVRAFGILLLELLALGAQAHGPLHAMAERCTQPDVALRPCFADLAAELQQRLTASIH